MFSLTYLSSTHYISTQQEMCNKILQGFFKQSEYIFFFNNNEIIKEKIFGTSIYKLVFF